MTRKPASERTAQPVNDSRRYLDADLIDLVQSLGSSAVDEFLDGLRPHLAAIQSKSPAASVALAQYLHDCAVSASVVASIGGSNGIAKATKRAASAPLEDPVDVLQLLNVSLA